MIGPHHSIIVRFTSTGHGAAAWTASCNDERSYFVRASSGSFSMRTNIVGTHWLCVTRYFSIAARVNPWSCSARISSSRARCCAE